MSRAPILRQSLKRNAALGKTFEIVCPCCGRKRYPFAIAAPLPEMTVGEFVAGLKCEHCRDSNIAVYIGSMRVREFNVAQRVRNAL